jgi:hypothetical protein
MKPLPVVGLSAMLLTPMLSSGPAGAKPVYKCEEGGNVTFTDQPCSPQATAATLPGLVVAEPPTQSQRELARRWQERTAREAAERERADGEWLKQHHDRKDRDARVRRAMLAHKVIKGMTFEEVKRSLGEPQRVSGGDSFGTDKESWTYEDGRTVNFKDGEVTTTSKRKERRRK